MQAGRPLPKGAALLALLLTLGVLAGGDVAPRLEPVGRTRGDETHLVRKHAGTDAGEREGVHEATEWWYAQRAYPRRTVDWAAYSRAFAQRDRLPAAVLPAPGPADGRYVPTRNWQFVGPNNLRPPTTAPAPARGADG